MKKLLIAMILLLVGILTSCGKEEEEPAVAVPVPVEILPVEEKEEPVIEEEEIEEPEQITITERMVVDGKMQSYLTGEWKDENVVKRRSMALMIANNSGALPQHGISRASIIYEAPVEGRITRLMGFFEDYDDLKYIGPARSARDYFVYEAMAYDAIFTSWGLAVPYVKPLIDSDKIDDISQALHGVDVAAPEAFDRISRPGYRLEYTGYLFIEGYGKAVERLGYEKEYRDQFVQAFTFINDGYSLPYENHEKATKIYPGGTTTNNGGYGSSKPYFEYNEENGLYYRYQNGSAHRDDMNSEQLAVSNVVFKVCHGEVRAPGDDYLIFGVHGEGKAYVFTDGRVIIGTWKREGDHAPNIFFDEEGKEVIFNQGKTWICNIWASYEEFVAYE